MSSISGFWTDLIDTNFNNEVLKESCPDNEETVKRQEASLLKVYRSRTKNKRTAYDIIKDLGATEVGFFFFFNTVLGRMNEEFDTCILSIVWV